MSTQHEAAEFGTSEFRAPGWKQLMDAVFTGDRLQGLTKDGTWVGVTVRVVQGYMEGRQFVRFVYVARLVKGARHESTFEAFATMHRVIERETAMSPTDDPLVAEMQDILRHHPDMCHESRLMIEAAIAAQRQAEPTLDGAGKAHALGDSIQQDTNSKT